MIRDTLALEDLWGVYSVPPLPRKADSRRSLDFDAAERVARHIADGGITRYLYGGNAFLYHISLAEYEALLDWLAGFAAPRWPIPSLGPSFGRALDQACVLRRHAFPTAMMLPCGDPRDPAGVEVGMREIADAAGIPLIIYLKSEDGFGSDQEQSLDAIGRLVDDGVAIAISTRSSGRIRARTRCSTDSSSVSTGGASSPAWASGRRSCIFATSSSAG